jgi:hypothetical protein
MHHVFLIDTCGTKLMYVYVLSQNVCMKGLCYALCFSFKISTHLGGVTHMRIFTLFGYLVFSNLLINCVVINHQKGGDCKYNFSYCGFSDCVTTQLKF